MAGLVAHNYADALFAIAMEEHKLDVYMDEFSMIMTSLDEEPEFMRLLAHPKMDKVQKKEMLESVFLKAVDNMVLNFLKLLIDKNRFSHVMEIGTIFHSLYNEEKGIQVALVTTARPLSEQESQRLTKMLEDKIQKKVELVILEDASLMAGIRVKIGDQVIDNTAKSRLHNLKELVIKSEFTKEAR